MSILLEGAWIITQNENRETLRGDILIEDNQIVQVGEGISSEGIEERIDCSRKIIFPGLVNAHTHCAMGLLRGYGEGLPLKNWLAEKIWPAEAKLKPEDIYWGSLLGMIEMIRSGTTSFSDMYPDGMERMADAAGEIGMRAVLGYGMMDKPEGRNLEGELNRAKEMLGELGKANPRIKGSVSAHSLYMCSEELVKKGKELANENGMLFQMHVSETREEVFTLLSEKKMRPVQYLESLGVLDSLSLFSHMGWVTKKEIEIAGKNGVSVAHCPMSSLKLAVGDIAPISEFMEKGANVCLGTDGPASNNSLNMLESLKMSLLLQSHKYWDPTRFSVANAWDSATLNGAKALGIHSGEISEGKLADLVIVDALAANLKPLPADLRMIAYSINPSNITDMIIDGKFVMKEGKIEFVDEGMVLEKAEDVAHELLNR